MNLSEKKRALEKSASYIVSRHGALKGIVEPFAALAAKRAEIRETLAMKGGPVPAATGNAQRGEPLLGPGQPLDLSGEFMLSAAVMLPALGEILPELRDDVLAVEKALSEGLVAPGDCVAAFLRRGEKDLGALGEAVGLPAERLAFILGQVVRPCMERLAEELGPSVDHKAWFRGYCPVCGLAPELGALKEIRVDSDYLVSKGGQLFMRCELCSFEWRFPRVKCPECGADHQKDNEFFDASGDPRQRVYVCKECKTYLPCLNMVDSLEALDPDIARIAFLPLEMRLRDMGCKPMAGGPVSIG